MTTRRLRVLEDSYLHGDLVAEKGDIVYEFTGATYGCISWSGLACSVDGGTPFFEVPIHYLEEVTGDE